MDVNGAAKHDKDAKGQIWNRLQTGADVYGSSAPAPSMRKARNRHEELAYMGPANDMACVSWFEDVNLDKR